MLYYAMVWHSTLCRSPYMSRYPNMKQCDKCKYRSNIRKTLEKKTYLYLYVHVHVYTRGAFSSNKMLIQVKQDNIALDLAT